MKLLRLLPVFLVVLGFGLVQAGSNEFSLADVNGKEHKLSDYKGKWVVVNYWATWCPPCVEEIPQLIFFHENHKDKDAVVLGVNFEEVEDQVVIDFAEEQMISYPVLFSPTERNTALGRVTGLPTTFVVSPEGKVVAKKVGKVDIEYLENIIGNISGKVKR